MVDVEKVLPDDGGDECDFFGEDWKENNEDCSGCKIAVPKYYKQCVSETMKKGGIGENEDQIEDEPEKKTSKKDDKKVKPKTTKKSKGFGHRKNSRPLFLREMIENNKDITIEELCKDEHVLDKYDNKVGWIKIDYKRLTS